MQTSPNQKTITVMKNKVEKGTGKERPYYTCYVDIENEAIKQLNTIGSLKAYLYIRQNQHNYTFALSTKDIAEQTGLSLTTAKSAINELIKKGFITKEKGNHYIFHELPEVINELPAFVAEAMETKQFRNSITGEVVSLTFKELVKNCGDDENLAKSIWKQAE